MESVETSFEEAMITEAEGDPERYDLRRGRTLRSTLRPGGTLTGRRRAISKWFDGEPFENLRRAPRRSALVGTAEGQGDIRRLPRGSS
jgi:hypothetical protein